MKVLVTGATGFIGSSIVAHLLAAGHAVVGCARRTGVPRPNLSWQACDYSRDQQVADWLPRLEHVDAVINAVGILQEHAGQRMEDLHLRAPAALFRACTVAGVARIIQISALGADSGAATPYHASKKAADDLLRQLDLDWVILQPSLVYGPAGQSARLFNTLASLPLRVVPGSGSQCVQPVHIDDLAEAVVRLLDPGAPQRQTIAAVGPAPLQIRDFLGDLRVALGLPFAPVAPVPRALVWAAAFVLEHGPQGLLSRDTLRMLERGNCAPAHPFATLLGRPPRPVTTFVAPGERSARRAEAVMGWGLPLLRTSLAVVWFAAAITSAFFFPHVESFRLLAQTGVASAAQPLAFWGAIALDMFFGILTLFGRGRLLWGAQLVLVVTYSVLIAWRLPEFWWHPYGPLVKNLPILALLLLLLALEPQRGR